MNIASTIYLSIAIIAFVLIVIALYLQRRKTKELSKLTFLAIMLVILGGAIESRLVGYSLIGAGVLITVFDFIKNRKKK